MAVRRGDDTDAFGFGFLTINLNNTSGYAISKAEVRIGSIKKVFNNPVFPLKVSLSRLETMKLSECDNKCFMAIYDTNGKKYTCEGSLSFKTEPEVV